jgi:3-dehydroquinate synthase
VKIGVYNLQTFVQQNLPNCIVLADKHTVDLCYPLLLEDVPHFIVPYGEGYKNLDSCEFIWKKLTELGANRDTILICLGGGVVCDMGAFAAGCYQRGIRTVLAPTTLLAMVDASIGGKNGVNFMGFKNYIGSFKEADETFICPHFLETLSRKEMVNGYVEMLKHGLIANKKHFDKVKLLFLKEGHKLDNQLIYDSIKIKKEHVEQDFKDVGIRKRLNFGHTIGHAIESHSLEINEENEALSHGVSVALGMIVESYISTKLAGLNNEQLNEITLVLQRVVSGTSDDIPTYEDLEPYLLQDKKNTHKGINSSLLLAIGDCQHDFYIEAKLIKEGLAYLSSLK